MQDIVLDKISDFKEFTFALHNVMVNKKINLVYEGFINQSIVKTFTSITESELEEEGPRTTRKVYHVMVECLQNICKHTDDIDTGNPIFPGKGIFMVGFDNDDYVVATGNVISNDKKAEFIEKADSINQLSPDELKVLYKKHLREGTISDKSGAGLGLIDIVKKTGNPIDYRFHEINDKTSFLLMVTKINRS